MKRPLTCVNLNKAIYRLAGAGDSVRLSRALADVVVAQMLPDGVVKGGSSHDLIDLQLMVARSAPDLADVRAKCLRLFAYRKRQPWPPTVAAGPDWGSVYEAALDTMQDKTGVLPTVDEAVAWANDLIVKIDAAAL